MLICQCGRFAKHDWNKTNAIPRPLTCSQLQHDNYSHNCACTTCHWCRQKTPVPKAHCAACGSEWCGWCLKTRFGENLDENRVEFPFSGF
jgi:hypothetical protein